MKAIDLEEHEQMEDSGMSRIGPFESAAAPFTRRDVLKCVGLAVGSLLSSVRDLEAAATALVPQAASSGEVIIRTLLGDIHPSAFQDGSILFHEHLSFHPQGTTAHFTDDVDMMVEEARAAKKDGIVCIIDASHADGSRSLDALKRIATGSGLPIVASGGYYLQRSYPPEIAVKSADDIADMLVTEASTQGFGALGEIGQQFGQMTPDEKKVFQAVGKAQVRTNLPIFTHSPYNQRASDAIPRDAALRQLDILESVGIKTHRVAIGHVCCLDDPKAEVAIALARRGAFVGFDRVTLESFMPDASRVRMAMTLIKAGYADQLLLSSDFSNVRALRKNGGPGLAQTVTVFGPLLRQAGLLEAALHRILFDNPRRFLAFSPEK
jgi:phosphotriesterase-related protein